MIVNAYSYSLPFPFYSVVSTENNNIREFMSIDCNVGAVSPSNLPLILSCKLYPYVLIAMIQLSSRLNQRLQNLFSVFHILIFASRK
jgi:hypothetical protein